MTAFICVVTIPPQLFVFHLDDISYQTQMEFNIHVLVATVTAIEYGTSFIGTPQLYRAPPDFFPPAFRACNLDDGFILHITSFDGLNS